MNRTVLSGVIKSDPVLSENKGMPILNFVLKCKSGKNQKNNRYFYESIECSAIGKGALAIYKKCRAGSRLLIEGKLHCYSIAVNDESVIKTEVLVENFEPNENKGEAYDIEI